MSVLQMRQRTAPPIDKTTTRRLVSSGGYDVAVPRTLAPGIEDQLARYPGTVYDGRIVRDRGPYYQVPYYMPPAQNWVNWTAAGPPRPELHMRNASWRNWVGNSHSRYPTVDTPTGGMHTMYPTGAERTAGRYVQTPQMRGARINRLSPARYRNQTYSQTTRLQGA